MAEHIDAPTQFGEAMFAMIIAGVIAVIISIIVTFATGNIGAGFITVIIIFIVLSILFTRRGKSNDV